MRIGVSRALLFPGVIAGFFKRPAPRTGSHMITAGMDVIAAGAASGVVK
jgi:hypothetical protein